MADLTSYVIGYAVSCARRGLTYMHYRMNYGRNEDMTDYFQLTREQYDVLLVALAKADNEVH